MSNGDLYARREQTLVKHIILKHYLERFAIIVGSHWDTLTYVDCFSGPWKVKSEKFEDSSFAIALDQLRKARDIHKKLTGKTLKLRCFFLEKDPSAYTKLEQFADQADDAIIETKNKKLEMPSRTSWVLYRMAALSHFRSYSLILRDGLDLHWEPSLLS